MEASEIFKTLGELVKPGSVILGVMVLIQCLHKILDSSRVYKIKQLELLHNCMKDLSNIGSAYTIEKLLERTYKVHISYDQAMVMMAHPQRQKLFDLYKASYQYITFYDGQFSLLPKYRSKQAICIEKHKYDLLKAFKYYGSSFVGAILFIIAFKVFYTAGLFKTLFYTFNIIWFLGCIVLGGFLLLLAIKSLIDPTNIKHAQKFLEHFDNGKVTRKVTWTY